MTRRLYSADKGRLSGAKELTGMVNLTRDEQGRVPARLLDLLPGRSGTAYAGWLKQCDRAFHESVRIATLDLFQGYKNVIDDQTEDAIAVLDAFHAVNPASQQALAFAGFTLEHRGTDSTPSGRRDELLHYSRRLHGDRPRRERVEINRIQPRRTPSVLATVTAVGFIKLKMIQD